METGQLAPVGRDWQVLSLRGGLHRAGGAEGVSHARARPQLPRRGEQKFMGNKLFELEALTHRLPHGGSLPLDEEDPDAPGDGETEMRLQVSSRAGTQAGAVGDPGAVREDKGASADGSCGQRRRSPRRDSRQSVRGRGGMDPLPTPSSMLSG